MSPFDRVMFPLFESILFKKNILFPADDRAMDESFNIPTATDLDGKSVYSATDRKIIFFYPFLFIL